jgi:hypothetical protein
MSHPSSIHQLSEVAREVDVSPQERGAPESVPDTDNSNASPATQADSRGDTAQTQSVEAHRRAAVILEVLAGVRGPSEAAAALEVSVSHYYLLERKALAGLVAGCESQPKGPRGPGLEQQLAAAERELEECRRECLRQSALVRATQRAMGLPASAAVEPQGTRAKGKAKEKGKGTGPASPARRRRRPTVRALRAAAALRPRADHDLQENSSGVYPGELLEPVASGVTRK